MIKIFSYFSKLIQLCPVSLLLSLMPFHLHSAHYQCDDLLPNYLLVIVVIISKQLRPDGCAHSRVFVFDVWHVSLPSFIMRWTTLPSNYLPVTAWCFPETAQTRSMCLFTCVCVSDVRFMTSWDDFACSVCTSSWTKKRAGGMKKDAALVFTLVLEQKGARIPAFIPVTVLTPLAFAATATGWSISECWRGAVSTASGKSRSAPSTGWWTSTELTASRRRKWSASETLPRPLACSPRRDVTLIPTLTEAAPRSPSSQPASTLTQRGSPPLVCWGYD